MAPTEKPTTMHSYNAHVDKAHAALGIKTAKYGRYLDGSLRPQYQPHTPAPSPAPHKLSSLVFCPNKCSGHGVCSGEPGSWHTCRCFVRVEYEDWGAWAATSVDAATAGTAGYIDGVSSFEGGLVEVREHVPAFTGPDCSEKTCPQGMQWAAPPHAPHDHTSRVECSGVGKCDRKLGVCVCPEPYTGVGCRFTTCPNDCSGHGKCYSQAEIARQNSHYGDQRDAAMMFATPHTSGATSSYTGAMYHRAWDSLINFGCVCDGLYFGADCSLKRCPSSEDTMGGKGAAQGRACSGRGLCNHETGHCTCFRGYFGATCETITAIMY